MEGQVNGKQMTAKKISGFTLSEDMGHSIDLKNSLAAIIVTPKDGTILFNEGPGAGNWNNAAVPAKAVMAFDVHTVAESTTISLRFRRGQSVDRHLLGYTPDVASATAWVNRVNALYEALAETLPLHDFQVHRVSIASFRAELPELLMSHFGQFAAYSGGKRIAICPNLQLLVDGLRERSEKSSVFLAKIVPNDCRRHAPVPVRCRRTA